VKKDLFGTKRIMKPSLPFLVRILSIFHCEKGRKRHRKLHLECGDEWTLERGGVNNFVFPKDCRKLHLDCEDEWTLERESVNNFVFP